MDALNRHLESLEIYRSQLEYSLELAIDREEAEAKALENPVEPKTPEEEKNSDDQTTARETSSNAGFFSGLLMQFHEAAMAQPMQRGHSVSFRSDHREPKEFGDVHRYRREREQEISEEFLYGWSLPRPNREPSPPRPGPYDPYEGGGGGRSGGSGRSGEGGGSSASGGGPHASHLNQHCLCYDCMKERGYV